MSLFKATIDNTPAVEKVYHITAAFSGRQVVSNHRHIDCLNGLFRSTSKTISKTSLYFCEENPHRGTVDWWFLSQMSQLCGNRFYVMTSSWTKLQLIWIKTSQFPYNKIRFKNVVSKMAVILSWPQWVRFELKQYWALAVELQEHNKVSDL